MKNKYSDLKLLFYVNIITCTSDTGLQVGNNSHNQEAAGSSPTLSIHIAHDRAGVIFSFLAVFFA